MRQKNEKHRQAILDAAYRIAAEEGPATVSIRRIATESGIATGTVYTYFPGGKDDILLRLAEAFWQATVREMARAIRPAPFPDEVRQMYAFLHGKLDDFRLRLMDGIRSAAPDSLAQGKISEQSMQDGIRDALAARLTRPGDIPPDTWTETFTPGACASFVLQNMLILLRSHTQDISFFTALLSRTLYPQSRNK